jgi:hypothetical protein
MIGPAKREYRIVNEMRVVANPRAQGAAVTIICPKPRVLSVTALTTAAGNRPVQSAATTRKRAAAVVCPRPSVLLVTVLTSDGPAQLALTAQ